MTVLFGKSSNTGPKHVSPPKVEMVVTKLRMLFPDDIPKDPEAIQRGCQGDRRLPIPRGSKYPIFEVSGPKTHTLTGFGDQSP